jgi:hypothetical protein
MSEAAGDTSESGGLYMGWDELRAQVSPGLGRDRFRALIKQEQQEHGFPPFRERWGGFYWPSVRQWLDSDNRIGADKRALNVDPEQEDGPETFDAAPGKKTRLQARPSRPALLDRQAGDPGRQGLSGHLRSVATGRDR